MSQELDKNEQLSEDQLKDVSGGLSERFQNAQQENLDAHEEGELPDEQLKGVAGGLSDRFQQAQDDNLDAHLTQRFDDARQQNLNSK